MNASTIATKDLKTLFAAVGDINHDVDDMMQAPVSSILDDGTEESILELFSEAVVSCGQAQAQAGGRWSFRAKRGGGAAAVKKCIKISVIMTLASALFLLIKIAEVDRVDCFAWYTPVASLLRTPIQNTYCNVLRSANTSIDKVIQKGIKAVDLPSLITAITAMTSLASLTYGSVVRFVKAFDTSIDVIVDYVYKEKTAGEAVGAVMRIVKNKKDADDEHEENEEDEEPQDGGRKAPKRKVAKAKAQGKPKRK
jgi:hypothetical protein